MNVTAWKPQQNLKQTAVSLPMKSFPILLVDGDSLFLNLYKVILCQAGFQHVMAASSLRDAAGYLSSQYFELVLIDNSLGTRRSDDLLCFARMTGHAGTVVIMGEEPSPLLSQEARSAGAFDYFVKNPELDIVAEVIRIFKTRSDRGRSLRAR